MSRNEQLALARRIDWRFLLPSPTLGRVACVEPIEAGHLAAIVAAATHVESGSLSALRSRGSWDVVIAPQAVATGGTPALASALELLEPGGWLMVDLPRHARVRRLLSRSAEALVDEGAEPVLVHWLMPDRARSSIVVPLGDPVAMQAALTRRRSTRAKTMLVGAARWLARAGIAPDMLAGDVRLLARRGGGHTVGGLPGLDPIAGTLEPHVGVDASWTLLTPRFGASAHVVLLLRSEGSLRLVAKIARLASDDGPEREGRMLEALVRAGAPPHAQPRPVFVGRTGGHAVLVETGLEGSLLDRQTLRGDPPHWIHAVVGWLRTVPPLEQDVERPAMPTMAAALQAIRTACADSDTPALVSRSAELLAVVDEGRLPTVTEHGDLSHPNIMVRPDGGIALLDWELARPDGLPLHDLCTFLDYVAVATSGDDTDAFDALTRVLSNKAWGAVAALRQEADRLGADTAMLPELVTACWVRMFAGVTSRLFDGGAPAPEGWHRRNRYYQLWERSVRDHDQLRSLLG